MRQPSGRQPVPVITRRWPGRNRAECLRPVFALCNLSSLALSSYHLHVESWHPLTVQAVFHAAEGRRLLRPICDCYDFDHGERTGDGRSQRLQRRREIMGWDCSSQRHLRSAGGRLVFTPCRARIGALRHRPRCRAGDSLPRG